MTSPSNGISAIRWQARIGLGSTKTAWLLLHKLRRAMGDPARGLLQDVVAIDETELPFRQRVDPTGREPGKRNIGVGVTPVSWTVTGQRPPGAGPIDFRAGALVTARKRAVTMSDPFRLTEAQMARLEHVFPHSRGKPRVDDRRGLCGIIFINRNGLR